jgi:hypothetical protein
LMSTAVVVAVGTWLLAAVDRLIGKRDKQR